MSPERYREPRASFLCWDPAGTPAENERRARLALGCACLADGCFASGGRFEWDSAWVNGGRYLWLKEYAVLPNGASDKSRTSKGWLGKSMEPAMQRGTGLWHRYFERGVVIANPTSKPVSTYESERYRAIDGPWKTAWSVPARDAIFLCRT